MASTHAPSPLKAPQRRRDARSLPERHRFYDVPLRVIICAPPLFFPLLAQVLGVLREHYAHHGRHTAQLLRCPAVDGCVQPERRLPAGVSWAVSRPLRYIFRMRAALFSALSREDLNPHAVDAPPQNTQPYARYLDVHDDVQVAPIRLLVDLHRGVRDRLDFGSLGMFLQIELLARRFYGGLEDWFALMHFY